MDLPDSRNHRAIWSAIAKRIKAIIPEQILILSPEEARMGLSGCTTLPVLDTSNTTKGAIQDMAACI
ncbi:MAG: hypothetical protein AB1466_06525 [Actinomycetota bacterium]